MLKRLVAISATLACLSLAACGNEGDGDSASDPSTPTESTSETTTTEPSSEPSSEPAAGGACEYVEDGSPAVKEVDLPPSEPTVSGKVEIVFQTTLGDIPATLDADATPCTVNSFVSLVNQGYYDATTCHRLTTDGIFVLQCGDPTASGSGGPGYSYGDELTGKEAYGPGTLAMANAGPSTNGSQFFMVYADSSVLDPAYTEFGTFDEAGVKLLTALAAKGTADGGPDGAPKEEVAITGVTIG